MNVHRYDAEIQQALAVYPQVPESWVRAVIGAETSFNEVTRDTWESAVGEYSYGPMQILKSTAESLGFMSPGAELRQPAVNILAGTAYIAQLMERVGGDFARMYSAYNSGNPDRYLTSSTVRANVDRALGWLNQFETTAAAALTENPAWVALAILGVLWIVPRVKRRL